MLENLKFTVMFYLFFLVVFHFAYMLGGGWTAFFILIGFIVLGIFLIHKKVNRAVNHNIILHPDLTNHPRKPITSKEFERLLNEYDVFEEAGYENISKDVLQKRLDERVTEFQIMTLENMYNLNSSNCPKDKDS